jgi:hypothetical protein
MIWETTLKKITDKTANHAAQKWVKNPTHLKLINNQINCVYRFESNGQGFYLRMTLAALPKDFKESKMKALRFHIIQLPGRIIQHARQVFVRVDCSR